MYFNNNNNNKNNNKSNFTQQYIVHSSEFINNLMVLLRAVKDVADQFRAVGSTPCKGY